jgi:sugar phosphate isomerase/epimerase
MAIPADILARLSYHVVYDDSIVDALQFAHARGFSGIQVALEMPHLQFAGLTSIEKRKIRDFAQDNSIRICLHGHDYMASLCEPEPHLRNGIFEYLSAMLDFAGEVGATLITLHGGSVPYFRTDTVPEQTLPHASRELYRQSLKENLTRLVLLNDERCTICIENSGLSRMLCEALQPHLAAGKLFLCWDLAKEHKARLTGDTLSTDFMHTNIAAVRQVHLNDVLNGHTHRVFGTGEVDLMSMLAMLPSDAVQDYCFEVRPREKALECMLNLRKVLCSVEAGR